MTFGQRFARAVTVTVVRVPPLWRVLRRPLTRNFDRMAPQWDALRVDARRLAAIDAALEAVDPAPARVLDLGTGSGAVARRAAGRWPGAAVTGADVSTGMIAEATRLADSPNQHYEVADASALPFADGSFDLVTMNNMIPFFDEVARVTAPGGNVAIAYGLGERTPIYVPLDRVRASLEQRGFVHVANFEVNGGLSLLARKRS
ncbi:MAG TPA: class I SAM-dependent methyltransferase [Gaiellaceae bacterium]